MIGITIVLMALCVSMARAGEGGNEPLDFIDNYETDEPLCSTNQQEGDITENGQEFDFDVLTPDSSTTFEICVQGDIDNYYEGADLVIGGVFYGTLGDGNYELNSCDDELVCTQLTVPTPSASTNVFVDLTFSVGSFCEADRVVVSTCGNYCVFLVSLCFEFFHC